jgi:hypothetical protein
MSDITKSPWATTDGSLCLLNAIEPTQWLTFASCGLRINLATGEVVIPDGLALHEASRQFWEQLGRFHPLAPIGFGDR